MLSNRQRRNASSNEHADEELSEPGAARDYLATAWPGTSICSTGLAFEVACNPVTNSSPRFTVRQKGELVVFDCGVRSGWARACQRHGRGARACAAARYSEFATPQVILRPHRTK